MEAQGPAVQSAPEITFQCSQCKETLVVDAAAAGLNLNCKRCGKLTGIPRTKAPVAPSTEKVEVQSAPPPPVAPSSEEAAVQSAPDITFSCSHCKSPLVVAAAAAGMTLDCQRCGKPTSVPVATSQAAPSPEKMADLQGRMKENESQRTEITGYINQLSIQLHRWQLRLQMLNDRKRELEAELRQTSV